MLSPKEPEELWIGVESSREGVAPSPTKESRYASPFGPACFCTNFEGLLTATF